jgi:hypothetical protein
MNLRLNLIIGCSFLKDNSFIVNVTHISYKNFQQLDQT